MDSLTIEYGNHSGRSPGSINIIPSEMYNVVILDEVNGAVNAGLLPISELTNLMDMKSNDLELVLTGRSAHPDILNRADKIHKNEIQQPAIAVIRIPHISNFTDFDPLG